MSAAPSLSSVFEQGGPIVAVLAVASVVATAVFLLRLLLLRGGRIAPPRLRDRVHALVAQHKPDEALTLCRMDDSSLARLCAAALERRAAPRADVKERLLEVGRREAAELLRGLVVLETVAVIAPLLGLLGTVWGMIEVFRTIESHGVGDAAALAGGIGTALYTTLAGLLVAIPVRVAHSWLQSAAEARVLTLEDEALAMLDLLAAP